MKKNKLLLLVILLLGIGFALVSATLLITGNVKIATNNADFDVKFTKAVLEETDISETAISPDGKTITFITNDLTTVGDISKLDFEVTNNSEMYDAEVSIECTSSGTNSGYYKIEKTVASPIVGKTTKSGKVEVSLLKASVNDFSETFTCTLTATAKERISRVESPEPLPLGYTPKYFEFGNPTTASTQDYKTLKYTGTETPAKVFVGLDVDGVQKSVCIVRNRNLECFRGGATTAYISKEQAHIREVFSDVTCSSDSSRVYCDASDFHCNVGSSGYVGCRDYTTNLYCSLGSSGAVNCR